MIEKPTLLSNSFRFITIAMLITWLVLIGIPVNLKILEKKSILSKNLLLLFKELAVFILFYLEYYLLLCL